MAGGGGVGCGGTSGGGGRDRDMDISGELDVILKTWTKREKKRSSSNYI